MRAWWAMGAAIAAFALLAERVEAAPGPPRNLEVLGGQGWQASTDFEVGWDNPAAAGEPPLAAAHYALRDGRGSVLLGPKRTELPVERLGVGVPRLSGSYELEVWLEDRAGAQGPPAVTLLRFDDTRPGASGPLPHPRWIGRAELPFEVRIGHPEGPVPPAGIRGYAVSVDREPGAEPCAGPERCSEDETDLHGGIDDDLLSAGELPEGLSYVHAVAVSGSGMRSAVTGSIPLWVDRTDPVTRLSGLPEGWVNRAVVLRASATDSASGMRADGGDGPFTAISVDGGRPTVAAGATVSATVIGDGIHTVSYYARDAAGNVADGASVNGHRDPPPPQAPVRIDRDPPTVVFVPSAHPGEPELIEARVSDRLSGPDTQRGWIGVRAAGGGAPFEPLPTVSQGDRLRARWNSDGYPPGEYEFAALGHDRAGNPALGTRRAGGAPMVLPSPLKTETRLEAWLGGDRRRRTQAVRYGRGTTYAGRLSLASGSPLGGAPVRVVERFAAAAGLPPRTTILITGPDGRFALHLPPGPSREVLASFIGNAARGRAEAPRQELAVRSGLRLSSSAASAVVGGRPVVFRGRVAGEIPAGGLAVQLQFRLPGLPWTEFRTLETDRRGRFRYAYRFSDDDSRGVRFLFRAFVTAQGDWPYEPGGSLPVDVRGV